MKTATTTIDTEGLKKSVDLRELAGRYTELRRESASEMHGPCPWCGGDDRFVVNACNFYCRPGDGHCGRHGDAIEFLRMMNDIDFKEACAILSGAIELAGPEAKRQAEAKHAKTQEVRWNEQEQLAQLKREQTALMLATEGQEFLLGRGLNRETWAAFGFGYNPRVSLPNTWDAEKREYSYPQQPAISMPWYKDGHLVAVRYRFLKAHVYTDADGFERKGQAGRGTKLKGYGPTGGNVFGMQAVPDSHDRQLRTLVVCEGELNDASIWQVAHTTALDVVSIGSQSSTIPDWLIERASQYKMVLVYTDESEIAHKLQQAIQGSFAVSSSVCGGKDANDLLQAGHLGGYLSAWRYKIARATNSAEWFIRCLAGGENLDEGTRRVLHDVLAASGA